jgi:hypothetical protein
MAIVESGGYYVFMEFNMLSMISGIALESIILF